MNLDEFLKDNDAFEKLMITIDKEIKNNGTPIPVRVSEATSLLSAKFNIAIAWNSPISQKINNWFENKYGDSLKVNFDIGTTLIEVDGDIYSVRLILCLGQCNVNVFHWIKNITPYTLNSLSHTQLVEIQNNILKDYNIFQNIIKISGNFLSDIKTATDKIMDKNPEYGLSRWGSLQASEKALKEYIKSNGGLPTLTHNIEKLINEAKKFGFPKIDKKFIDAVNCDASVRYNEEVSSKMQAYEAYRSSLEICNTVANQIK